MSAWASSAIFADHPRVEWAGFPAELVAGFAVYGADDPGKAVTALCERAVRFRAG